MTARVGTEAYAANLALGHLGQGEIADLGDTNVRARAVNQFFAITRDDLLRRKWWSFAKGWDQPAADTAISKGVLKTRYVLPTDCLRVRYIGDGDGATFDENDGAWDIESGVATVGGAAVDAVVLVTNVTSPIVAYSRRIENVALWDPVFLIAFSYELAARAARRLARGSSQPELHQRAENALETAASIDSKEQSRQKIAPVPSWLTARYGGRTVTGR